MGPWRSPLLSSPTTSYYETGITGICSRRGRGLWEELAGVEGPCGRGGWEKRTGCRVSRPFWPFPVPSGGEGECRLGVGGFRTLKLSLYKLGKVEGYFWVGVWGRTLRSLTRGSQI